MNRISDYFQDDNQLLKSITNFVNKFIGCSLLRKCGITKVVDSVTERGICEYYDNPLLRLIGDIKESRFLEKCVSAKQVLIDKILLCFYTASAYMMFRTGTFFGSYKKDTFYRFDLLPKANWEMLQIETASNVITDILFQTKKGCKTALVFDDSLYRRTGGKGTELCAKVFDHNDRKQRNGYRMMTGGWTNGEVFIPFAQVLLTTRNESLMVGKDDPVDGRTIRGKRRKRAKEKGTVVVQAMVQEAQKANIQFDYVLFDTWFSNPSQLVALNGIGANVIAMIKKGGTKYTWKNPDTGKEDNLNVKEIFSRSKKRRGRSRYLLSVEVTVSDQNGNSIPARLVYARNQNNRKDWVCFVCTDMSLDEEEVIRAYTMRWSIETYFRIAKSYLKLRTECHSTSYDAITAHMVIVAIRYMILAVERFNNTDNRSLEELFYEVQRDVMNEMMHSDIKLLLDLMLECVKNCFNATDDQISELICAFIDKLPNSWKEHFLLPETA